MSTGTSGAGLGLLETVGVEVTSLELLHCDFWQSFPHQLVPAG